MAKLLEVLPTLTNIMISAGLKDQLTEDLFAGAAPESFQLIVLDRQLVSTGDWAKNLTRLAELKEVYPQLTIVLVEDESLKKVSRLVKQLDESAADYYFWADLTRSDQEVLDQMGYAQPATL